MLKVRDWRIRMGLVLVLLAVIAAAIFQYALGRAASREYQLAKQALDHCDFEEAGVHLENYLAQSPSDLAARLLAATTARRRGDFAVAGRHLQLASKRGAKENDVALERSLLKIQEGDLTEATQLLGFYKENRNNPEARAILEALIAGSLRAREVAIAVWSIDEWMQRSTGKLDRARGIFWSAEVYLKAGQREIAYARYDQAAALAPDYLPAHLAVASALIYTDPHKAAAEIDWLQRHAPKHASVRLVTAQWQRSLGQPEEARQPLDELLAVEPEHVLALLERGRVAIDLNDAADAERWLRRALKLAPENIEINTTMSNCLRLANRLDEAKTYQEKARQEKEAETKYLDEMLKRAKGAIAIPH